MTRWGADKRQAEALRALHQVRSKRRNTTARGWVDAQVAFAPFPAVQDAKVWIDGARSVNYIAASNASS